MMSGVSVVKTNHRMEFPMKQIKLVSILSLLLPISALAASAPGESADQIFKDVEHRVSAKDESAKIVMTITEANGATKTREIEIKRKSGDTPKVLVKLQSPADLRGTALLSVGGKGKAEDQWLYLPSNKQTRRIVSSNKSSSFLDSEMSYEDLGSSSDKKFANKILRTETAADGPVAVIESTLTSGDSTYSKMITWVATTNDLVQKVEYYDRKGALLKTTEMSDYKKFPGDIWRAQTINVKNAQNHRGTELQMKDVAINKGISDSDFSVNALSQE
jgi:outer membrane lipoprotein-sorting protein